MKTKMAKRITLHIAFWILYTFVTTAYYTMGVHYGTELLYQFALLPFPVLFTYSQLYLLIPQLLLKKKILPYILCSLAAGKVFLWLNFLCYNYFVVPEKYGLPRDPFWYDYPWALHIESLKSAFSFVMICGIAVSIKLLKHWYFEKELNQSIEKEKLKMEVEMLKAQLHPHFLFNTLNNLYSLTLVQSPIAPVVVTHLSALLRYMLYECNAAEVPLNNEIAAIKQYVELEKLRYGNRLDISFSVSGDTSGLVIAPLLLLPFAENSFKHGISEHIDQCWINIHFHADKNNLVFNLSNSTSSKDQTAQVAGGIGLQNIQKRLDLLYKGQYTLSIIRQEEMYSVKLILLVTQPTGKNPGITKPVFVNNVISVS